MHRLHARPVASIGCSLLIAICVSIASTASAQSEPNDQSPVGVWELVELTNWTADGAESQPYGSAPSGLFIYTEDGHLSIQISDSD